MTHKPNGKCEICQCPIYIRESRVPKDGKRVCRKCRFDILRSNPSMNPKWKGGRIVNWAGYIHIHSPNHPFKSKSGYVQEHRLVMEKHLGRYLTRKEVVHHINGVRDDNRIENLVLFSNHGEHRKAHNSNIKCKFCGKPSVGKEMCRKHYARFWRTPKRRYKDPTSV